MTVLTSQQPLVGTGLGRLPRVNLLPPEIAQQRAFRRIQVGLGLAGVGAVAVVGLLYGMAASSDASAQQALSDAQANHTRLQSQVQSYQYVTDTINKVQAEQAQLTSAMQDEIQYSQMLNDLSLTVPSNVWLKSLQYGAAPTAAAPGTPSPVLPGGLQAVGTLTVTGVGFSHDDVASWLDAIANLKTYANPYFSNSTESLLGTRKIVTFSSSATVTSKALSNRYTNAAGS